MCSERRVKVERRGGKKKRKEERWREKKKERKRKEKRSLKKTWRQGIDKVSGVTWVLNFEY